MANFAFKADRAASVDALGRLAFATALSRSLTLPTGAPGVVVGIEGDWGSGKSTVIQLVLSALRAADEASRPVVMEFNPWMISTSGNLIESFLLQLARNLSIDPLTERARRGITASKCLVEYGAALRFARYLPGIAGSGEEISAAIEAIASAGEVIEAGAPIAHATLDKLEKLLPAMSLPEKKNAVEKALQKMDRPILVVIDDLDRLLPDEMRTVFQMVKAVADFPRVAYLIAYDKKVVAESLSTYGISGGSYLEKIVQVAYPVPPIFGWRMHQFVSSELEHLLSNLTPPLAPYETELWKRALRLAADLCLTPRDAVRLTNRLMISLPATRGNVNAADVVVFEAVAQRFGELRNAILHHPKDFIGFGFRDVDTPVELEWIRFTRSKEEAGQESWMKHLPEDPHLRVLAQQACYFLFPKLRSVSYGPPENQLRIADPDRLARLFSLTSLEIVPEASQIHALLADASELEFEIQNAGNDDLGQLLQWAAAFLPSARQVDIPGCVRILAGEACKRKTELSDDLARSFGALVTQLLVQSPTEVVDLFNELVDGTILFLAEDVLMLAVREHGLCGYRPQSSSFQADAMVIKDKGIVLAAMERWCARVELASADDCLASEPSLHSILFRLAQLGSFSRAFAVIGKLKESDSGLARFVDEFPPARVLDLGTLTIVEDAEVLAAEISYRLEKTPRREEFLGALQDTGVIEAVRKHTAEQLSAGSAQRTRIESPPTSNN